MEMIFIKRDSQEWNNMWKVLSDHPINENLSEPTLAFNNGEVWQYLGSYKNKDVVIHEFRHRNHPKYERVEYLKFYGSDTIADEDIEKKVMVK